MCPAVPSIKSRGMVQVPCFGKRCILIILEGHGLQMPPRRGNFKGWASREPRLSKKVSGTWGEQRFLAVREGSRHLFGHTSHKRRRSNGGVQSTRGAKNMAIPQSLR